MHGIRYVYWQDDDEWLGHLEEYPDYLTQGKSLADLEAHLRDLLKDLSSGVIPCVRWLAELQVLQGGFTNGQNGCKHVA
jgi:hypothetical protein